MLSVIHVFHPLLANMEVMTILLIHVSNSLAMHYTVARCRVSVYLQLIPLINSTLLCIFGKQCWLKVNFWWPCSAVSREWSCCQYLPAWWPRKDVVLRPLGVWLIYILNRLLAQWCWPLIFTVNEAVQGEAAHKKAQRHTASVDKMQKMPKLVNAVCVLCSLKSFWWERRNRDEGRRFSGLLEIGMKERRSVLTPVFGSWIAKE